MSTESTRAKKKKAPKAHEMDGFNPLVWDGVELKEGKPYYVVRSRGEIPGITEKDVAENPHEVVEAKFLTYSARGKEYAFDDGRLSRQMIYLAIPVEDREAYIYPNTPDGKAKAKAFVKAQHERHAELFKAARDKDEKVCLDAATEASQLEKEVMVIALGGDPAILRKAGKSPAKKVQAIIELRAAYFESIGKKPIPDRQSSSSLKK